MFRHIIEKKEETKYVLNALARLALAVVAAIVSTSMC